MLAKLIKHEFKATARIFLPILGTVLVLTGAAALTVKLGGILVLPGGTGWGGPVLGLASGLLCLLTFIAMMAMMTAAVVVTIQRFYKNLLGDEGYLMFTLPVTPAQHITAKLAVGTVWTLLSLALAVLAAAALIFSIPGAAENGMTLARFSASLGLSVVFWSARGWAVVGVYAGLTFCYSALAAVLPALSTDLFGLPHAGVNYGFLALGQSVGSLLFPFIANFWGFGPGRHVLAIAGAAAGFACIWAVTPVQPERPKKPN